MAHPPTADIIPFPSTRLSTPFYGPAIRFSPDDRLNIALKTLSAALAEQQRAIQNWRDAMAELAVSMRALGSGLPHRDGAEPHKS
jgi:hypothetical protein